MNAIALVSGGMDSTTALYSAIKRQDMDVVAAIHFTYGQQGHEWEYAAAAMVLSPLGKDIPLHRISLQGLANRCALTQIEGELAPNEEDTHGNPSTFVPGRNMIQIAQLLPYCYSLNAPRIVGGWVEQDVAYPDCRAEFLGKVAEAASLALDTEIGIYHPVLTLTKTEVVALGNELEVPWKRTRSCYGPEFLACGQCDSCLLRLAAFQKNGMRDPAYMDSESWDAALGKAIELGYL